MVQPKDPTLKDIYKLVAGMNERLTALESWKIGLDIAKAAVDEYKIQEQAIKNRRQLNEVLKQVGVVLGLLVTILYVYIQTHGVKQ